MSLRAERAERVAEDIQLYELRRPDGGELPAFTAGAHVLVKTPNGLIRRYSLANAPQERDRYVIAVKREENGRGGSISLVDGAKAGDTIEVSAPRNDFELAGNPASYLFIAGGIGITPIRSMIHHLRNTGGKPYKLYYLSRSPEMTAFRDEFIAPEYRGKAIVHHDLGDVDQSLDLWPVLEKPKGAHLYCCGPRGLMEAVRDMTGHWSPAAVHFEDFGAGKAARAADDKTVHRATCETRRCNRDSGRQVDPRDVARARLRDPELVRERNLRVVSRRPARRRAGPSRSRPDRLRAPARSDRLRLACALARADAGPMRLDKALPMIEDPPLLQIRRNFKRVEGTLLQRFAGVPTEHLADAMDGRGALDFMVKPIDSSRAGFVGSALTCQCAPGDNLAIVAALAQLEARRRDRRSHRFPQHAGRCRAARDRNGEESRCGRDRDRRPRA